ncbi:hypothetical protein KIPB_013012, partial [Kipferlia bialata]
INSLGASVYVMPPPGGRYTPLPMDPSRPGQPLPMSAQVSAVTCCSKKSLVNMSASVPSLVASVGRGTVLSVSLDNVGQKPITKIMWHLRVGMVKRLSGDKTVVTGGDIAGIHGVFTLPTPLLPGDKTQTPVQIPIQPNSRNHRHPDNRRIPGYNMLGEYAWERHFLTLPCQDYRKHNRYI